MAGDAEWKGVILNDTGVSGGWEGTRLDENVYIGQQVCSQHDLLGVSIGDNVEFTRLHIVLECRVQAGGGDTALPKLATSTSWVGYAAVAYHEH